jgi:hypothetical protein
MEVDMKTFRRTWQTHVAIVAAVLLLAPIVVDTQSAPAGQANYKAPRTWFGDPDLQGVWSTATITPLQRPDDLAGKEFLTPQEAAEREARIASTRVDAPPRDGDPGTYNQIWFDRGTKMGKNMRTSLIIDPPDGKLPAYTPEAAARQKTIGAARDARLAGTAPFMHWTDLDTGERCITDGLPMMPYAYNNNYRIAQTPGWVVITHEMFHHVRTIPLDGRPHVSSNIRGWLGDARGRWEGDTLVVESTNFSDKVKDTNNPRGAGGEKMTLVERFTRVDPTTIRYTATISDPTTFTRPWTVEIPMSSDQDSQGATVGHQLEYACHEGNYAVPNVLGGGRLQVQEEAKGGAR